METKIKDLNLRLLYQNAKQRFESVRIDNENSFTVYSNDGNTAFVFTLFRQIKRFTIGVSLTNCSNFAIDFNITQTALFGDVQIFFNMIYESCQMLPDYDLRD